MTTLSELIQQLEALLPRLREYEQNFRIEEEERAVKEAKYFYSVSYELHKQLAAQERKIYPELLYLFNHYETFRIHKLDQSVRTPGNSTWTLNTSWTLVIDTPVGTFGVYTLARAIVDEFKKLSST